MGEGRRELATGSSRTGVLQQLLIFVHTRRLHLMTRYHLKSLTTSLRNPQLAVEQLWKFSQGWLQVLWMALRRYPNLKKSWTSRIRRLVAVCACVSAFVTPKRRRQQEA